MVGHLKCCQVCPLPIFVASLARAGSQGQMLCHSTWAQVCFSTWKYILFPSITCLCRNPYQLLISDQYCLSTLTLILAFIPLFSSSFIAQGLWVLNTSSLTITGFLLDYIHRLIILVFIGMWDSELPAKLICFGEEEPYFITPLEALCYSPETVTCGTERMLPVLLPY